MRKALFLLLFSGQAMAFDCGNVAPGHPDFVRCAQMEQSAKQQTPQVIYVPQPVYVQPTPQPYQLPTNAIQPLQLHSKQPTRTECRRALGGGIDCTTY